jgi:glycosyltransferase involved in cell wall biosynthesis
LHVALDATYSLGDNLSGVGVYSREILHGLARTYPEDRWDWFYRSHRFGKALRSAVPRNVTRRLLSDVWGSRSAPLFHGLNQRLPRRRFRRQIATFHDLFVLTGDYSTAEFRARFAAQAREAAAAADLIIAVSSFTADQVESLLGVPRARIRVVHHGVLPRVVSPAPASQREKIVLSVGALQRRKNQKAIVEAFAHMPDDWSLVLAGSAGYGAEAVTEAVRNSPAQARIRATGYATEQEIADWYARAALFVFPSFDEGFGMPVLEAMAAGIPVISSNRSALPEVCGDAAWLVDPADTEELTEAMRELSKNETRRDELTSRGRWRSAQFTWEQAVTQTHALYQELPG